MPLRCRLTKRGTRLFQGLETIVGGLEARVLTLTFSCIKHDPWVSYLVRSCEIT
jgi:hypothetical protein